MARSDEMAVLQPVNGTGGMHYGGLVHEANPAQRDDEPRDPTAEPCIGRPSTTYGPEALAAKQQTFHLLYLGQL